MFQTSQMCVFKPPSNSEIIVIIKTITSISMGAGLNSKSFTNANNMTMVTTIENKKLTKYFLLVQVTQVYVV